MAEASINSVAVLDDGNTEVDPMVVVPALSKTMTKVPTHRLYHENAYYYVARLSGSASAARLSTTVE